MVRVESDQGRVVGAVVKRAEGDPIVDGIGAVSMGDRQDVRGVDQAELQVASAASMPRRRQAQVCQRAEDSLRIGRSASGISKLSPHVRGKLSRGELGSLGFESYRSPRLKTCAPKTCLTRTICN